MKKFIKYLIIILILLGTGYFTYTKFFKPKDEIDYFTIKPTNGDLVNFVAATGEVLARDLVDVGAQVSGQIQKLYVNLGDEVKKGDIIAEIDSVKQANEIANLEAQKQILLADLNASTIAFNIAQKRFEREKRLYNANATSKESLENAENNLALNRAKIEQIKAQINQNSINLNTATTNLGYTKIVAPLDGTIVSVVVKEGQTVNANQSTPVIVQIADLTKLEINMQIAEGDLPKIKKGMEVRYSILADTDKKMKGEISSIDPAMTTLSDGVYSKNSLSSNSNKAVYYYAKILVDNNDNFLKIGMTIENNIIISESKNTIYIPKSSIFSRDGKFFVKVLSADRAIEKEVELGIEDGFYQEVIGGIDLNDELIVNIANTISDETKPKKQMKITPKTTRM